MSLQEKLTSIALGVDERIGQRICIRAFKDHAWLLTVPTLLLENEQNVCFRALMTVLVRLGPDAMIAVLPVSPVLETYEYIEYLLMVGAHVSTPKDIPSYEHLRRCSDHQRAIYDAFTDFLTYSGFVVGALKNADSIVPVRFTCPS